MKLETIRADIERKAHELDTVTNAQRPIEEGVADIVKAFDQLSESSRGADYLSGVLASDGGERAMSFDTTYLDPHVAVQAGLLLIGRAAVEKQAREILTTHSNGHKGIAAADRAASIARIKDEIAELARKEESAILKLEVGDTFVPRRAECDPALILEVWRNEL